MKPDRLLCYMFLFSFLDLTVHNVISIPIILNLLTYKNIALIEHGQGISKIKCSTVVFIFDFTSFHNRSPLLILCNRSLRKQPAFRDASSGFPA